MKNILETKGKWKYGFKPKVFMSFRHKSSEIARKKFMIDLNWFYPDIYLITWKGMNSISEFYCKSCETHFSCKPNSITGKHKCGDSGKT